MVKSEREGLAQEEARIYLEKLEEKLEYYKQNVINSSDAVIIQDFNGIVKAWNKGAERIYGFTEKEMLGKSILKVIAREYHAEAKKNINLIKQGKPTFKVKQIRKTKDNQKIFVNITYSPIYEKGEIVEIGTSEEDVSELKKSIEKLKGSEEKFRSIFEHSEIGVSIVGIDGKWLEVNPALCKMTGYSKKELLSKGYLQLTIPEDIEKTKNFSKRLINGKKDYGYLEKRYITKDKKIIWVYLSVTLIREAHAPKYFVVHTENITERKKVETELKMYKEHLEFLVKNRTLELEKEKSFSESVIENIPNMIFVKDAKELKFELFNRAGEKLLGQKRENLIGKSDYNFFPKKQADFFTNKDRHVLKSKKLLDIPEEPIKTPRGERLLHTKKIPILNKQGKPLSLLGISEDITERKEAEEKYKSLYESSADAIMTLEPPSWKFTSGNPATIKMFKIKNEKEFISKAPWEYSPKYQPDKQLSSEKAKKMIMRAMEEGSNLFEWTHKRFNGENFPATVLLSRIKRDGKTYLQATVRDITEQKKMEEKAKESDIMKTEFLSAISHELRTPITPIKSQIQRLLSTELDKKEQIDSLEIALRNTIRMDRLIQDLLEISRIKAGKFNIFKKKADLNKTINEAIIDLSGFIKEKNTSITFEAGKIPEINMDRDRILEVIINILDNSIKFGKGKISISTKKEGNSILIKIKDNGIGIIQNEKIFSPFYRGEKIDSQKYEGTGLGLSICRGIIETHNGKIWFDSKRGEGTTFFVKIPIK